MRYLAVGLMIAIAFVVSGVTRVQPAAPSVGARIIILSGALLSRWLKSRS